MSEIRHINRSGMRKPGGCPMCKPSYYDYECDVGRVRHIHEEFAAEEPAQRNWKKKTLHWCKGKVGREHRIEHAYRALSYTDRKVKIDQCVNCGKIFNTHYDTWWYEGKCHVSIPESEE